MRPITQMLCSHYSLQSRFYRPRVVEEEIGNSGERLVGFSVGHVKYCADQKRMAGLLPVIAAFECALGVDQDVDNVLDVADFAITTAHFQQRIVGTRVGIGWIEQQHSPEPYAPFRREPPILALDVVNDGGTGPGQQGRNDEADARLARNYLGSISLVAAIVWWT
jgi:hypothetical protein